MIGPWRIAALATGMILACHGQVDIHPRPKRPDDLGKQPPSTLRVDTNLVLVPVSVSDPMNRTVTGLEKENFQLLDNGVEQTITHFAREDEPIAAGFVRRRPGGANIDGVDVEESQVRSQKSE